MTESADLLQLHIAALFTQDEHGSLVATNDPEPDQVIAPRLYLGRSDSGGVLRFRRGMSESTCAALRDLAAPDPTLNDCNREPVNRAAIVDLLAAEQPIENIYFGPAFSFPDALNHESPWTPISRPLRHSGGSRNPVASLPEVVEISPSNAHLLSPEVAWLADELNVRAPVMAMVVDGASASVCFSARSSRDASEAGVETLPEHRGRRYAGAVTAAWAAAVRRQGRIPLYSTSWTNHASRRVAARLGLTQYATDFHIT